MVVAAKEAADGTADDVLGRGGHRVAGKLVAVTAEGIGTGPDQSLERGTV